MDTGSTTLAFASYSVAEYNGIEVSKVNTENDTPAFELAFVTDDIEKSFKQAIDAGATMVKEPVSKPWGQMVGYMRDQNGFLVELCTPLVSQ